MPVLDSERQRATRSALRYRPLHTDQAQPGSLVPRRRSDVQTSTASELPDDQLLDEEDAIVTRAWPPGSRRMRAPSSSRGRRRAHPLFWLGVVLLTLLVLWVVVTGATSWVTNRVNDWRYGYPRVFQLDAVLGHQDSAAHPTHLLALNLHGEIVLEEFPGGDIARARSYILTSLVGSGSDLLPVTLRLIERKGHAGKPDLVVEVGETLSLLVNDQGAFRPPAPAERQQILPLLQS